MTTGTFSVVLTLTIISLCAAALAVWALRSKGNNRAGAGPALAASVLLLLSTGAPALWQVTHYFDLRDGRADYSQTSTPVFWAAAAMFIGAAGLAALAAVQRLMTRSKARAS